MVLDSLAVVMSYLGNEVCTFDSACLNRELRGLLEEVYEVKVAIPGMIFKIGALPDWHECDEDQDELSDGLRWALKRNLVPQDFILEISGVPDRRDHPWKLVHLKRRALAKLMIRHCTHSYDLNAPAQTDKDNWTPLHFSAHSGDVMITRLLLENESVNPESRGSWGVTPLHIAASDGRWECAMALLDGGVSVDIRDDDAYTPLHCASYSIKFRVATLLHKRGADVNALTNDGETPLDLAQEAMGSVLTINMAGISTNNNDGDFAVETPQKKEEVALIQFLEGKGAKAGRLLQ
jgi:hypothetical protein